MPHQCVHCAKIYDDASKEVLTGCSQCGGRFFFYIKKEKLQQILDRKGEEAPVSADELSAQEKVQIEKDVREIAGLSENDEKPIFLDFESIKIIKPGKYVLDLSKLFASDKPRIYQLEDGKYIIDLTKISNIRN